LTLAYNISNRKKTARCDVLGLFGSREKAALAYEIARERMNPDTLQQRFDIEAEAAAATV
jgi:precorrin-2 methylase